MFNPKTLARNLALAGALPLLVASSAFAQYGSYQRTDNHYDHAYANRTVDGTVASVWVDRNGGQHVRLTSGMDVVVPNSVTAMNEGRRYQASMLQPGDVVRLNVFSRQGDGRDAQVRSVELLDRSANRRMSGYNDRLVNGTVVSFDRRANVMVVQTDNGRTMNVDLNSYRATNNRNWYRRGERVSITGRMNRGGSFIADGVRAGDEIR
jgi:phage baseplate assembly protein gpV